MSAIDYCTVAEVRTYSGLIDGNNIGPTDAELATMITNASRLVDMYAGRQLAGTISHIEYHDSTYRMTHIALKNKPIASITSVEETKSDGSTTVLEEGRKRDGTDDWWLDDSQAGIIRFHNRVGLDAINLFKISYTSGIASAPIEAKMATILLVIRQAARASLNDENSAERIKQFWRPLLDSTEKEYKEYLEKVKSNSFMAVSVFGNGGA